MATIPRTPSEAGGPYVPPLSADERARRNRKAMALLQSWATDGDDQEQQETMTVLHEALGKSRTLSSRALFP